MRKLLSITMAISLCLFVGCKALDIVTNAAATAADVAGLDEQKIRSGSKVIKAGYDRQSIEDCIV